MAVWEEMDRSLRRYAPSPLARDKSSELLHALLSFRPTRLVWTRATRTAQRTLVNGNLSREARVAARRAARRGRWRSKRRPIQGSLLVVLRGNRVFVSRPTTTPPSKVRYFLAFLASIAARVRLPSAAFMVRRGNPNTATRRRLDASSQLCRMMAYIDAPWDISFQVRLDASGCEEGMRCCS
jgi:hypothetical protein